MTWTRAGRALAMGCLLATVACGNGTGSGTDGGAASKLSSLTSKLTDSMPKLTPPAQEIDVVAIKTELVQIGKAEQRYWVTHSTYGTIEELRKDELLVDEPDRRGYAFTTEVNGAIAFKVTATPTNPDKAAWPTLWIDNKMEVVKVDADKGAAPAADAPAADKQP